MLCVFQYSKTPRFYALTKICNNPIGRHHGPVIAEYREKFMQLLHKYQCGLCLILALALTGCAGNYHDTMSPVYHAVQSGNYQQADELLSNEPELSKGNERLLYLLDKGMIAHLNGDYRQSNQFFEQAIQQFEALDYISVTGTASEWIISELGQPYRGEDFERVMVHYYMALNYLMLDDLEDALVECRRLNTLLRELNDQYEQKNVYKTDAFALYLSGLIYEAMGATNDAFIDYRKAYDTYTSDYGAFYGTSVPAQLHENLLRTASALGFDDEFKRYAQDHPDLTITSQEAYRQSARLVVIWDNGLIPYKIQRIYRDYIDLGKRRDEDGCYLKFAFPVFVPRPSLYTQATVSIAGQTQQLELTEDLSQIAMKNLEDRRLRTLAKAIARNIVKCTAERELQQQNEVLGWLFALFTEVTEQADTRSWLLLPSNIQIAQFLVPPGSSEVTISYVNPFGQVGSTQTEHVTLEAGKTTFIMQRTF